MFPLYRDPWYTFRFAEARRIPAFHLEDAREGASVAVFRADSVTGLPGERLTDSVVGPGGWVHFAPELIVAAGDVLLAEVFTAAE